MFTKLGLLVSFEKTFVRMFKKPFFCTSSNIYYIGTKIIIVKVSKNYDLFLSKKFKN
jgi:hypothetical protein